MTGGPGTGGVCVQNPWYLWYGPNTAKVPGCGNGRLADRGSCSLALLGGRFVVSLSDVQVGPLGRLGNEVGRDIR
jgi:hypothetical protein